MSETKNSGRFGPGNPGKPKGALSKSTKIAREAIARFVDGNTDRLQGWLDEIAQDPKHGPREAFRCLMDVMEYHVPKLARHEVTGEEGGPVKFTRIEAVIVDPRDSQG